jgi:hypothetical protein
LRLNTDRQNSCNQRQQARVHQEIVK